MTKITVMNTLNGQTDVVEENFLDNPTFAEVYVKVPEGTKPYASGFYTARTAEEFTADKPERVVKKPTAPKTDEKDQ